MTYTQARKTGSVLDGYVKCTFAQIWHKPEGNWDMERFFSFQQPGKNAYVNGVGKYEEAGEEKIIFFYDYPLFKAVDLVDTTKTSDKWIPVTLTDKAYKYMMERISSSKYHQIHPDTVWYVKESAVEWMPTNIDNATIIGTDGKEIRLDDAIDQAAADIEAKKKLLIAAGVATLIL